jgi:hypothetical protein
VVFDFVDNATRYNHSLSLHRVLGTAQYRAGSLVLAPHDLISQEQLALGHGKPPTQILPVDLWTQEFQEIDVFNWQESISGMLSASELDVELAASEGRVRTAVDRDLIVPDHILTLGERTYYYFLRERVEEVRQALGLPRVDDSTIRELFLDFVVKMDMSSSYKPVLLLAILDNVDEHGRASIHDLVQAFRAFYLGRLQQGLTVERPGRRMEQADRLSHDEVRLIMLGMPFRKFEQRKYVAYDRRDLSHIRFQAALWRRLTPDDRTTIRGQCETAITQYYERTQP